jgi:hypothetical protein
LSISGKFASIFLSILLIAFSGFSQVRKLRGKVVDDESGQGIPGAQITALSEKKAVFSDSTGNFLLQVSADTGRIRISFPAFEARIFRIEKWPSGVFSVRLRSRTLGEITIEGSGSAAEKVSNNQMSVENLSVKEAKLLPAIFGEVDLIKTLQLKPGVQGGGEGFAGLYVRGGGPDQNLFLVDGATVYNPNHLFGFFSMFNPDAVSSVDLYKAAFPGRYSGRLSSVVDVKMREGKSSDWSVNGGLGLISSRLSVEGPILKDKVSFIASGRRTYFDVFTRAYNKSREGRPRFTPIPDYYFQDFNAKIVWNAGPKDKISLTGYTGRDVFVFSRNRFNVQFDWGNSLLSLRWQKEISDKINWDSRLVYSDYNYKIENKTDGFSFGLRSGIRDIGIKSQLSWQPVKRSRWESGFAATRHGLEIGRASASSSDGRFRFESGSSPVVYSGNVFLSNETDFSDRLQLNSAMVLSSFLNEGKLFSGLEPRASLRWMAGKNVALKLSYARMFQYLHLASNSGASLPTDLWYPSNQVVLPEIASQTAAGYSLSLFDNQLFFSNEYYYKSMQRQIDLKDGASFFVNDKLDTVFVFGDGWSYGTEWYLEKKKGRLTGWLGYTLSWTWRQFPDVNFGEKFHPRYDRRHDVSAVLLYKISDRVQLSTTWVYGSGNAVSLPESRYFFQDLPGTNGPDIPFTVIPVVKRRNSFRLAPYHRWDIGLVWKLKPKRGESELNFSVYNAYNRLNPFFIYFETLTQNEDGSGGIAGFRARQVSLFPVIPSVTWNFKW